jgi:hypothetical protein
VKSLFFKLGWLLLFAAGTLFALWALGALWVDAAFLHPIPAFLYALILLVLLSTTSGHRKKAVVLWVCPMLVLAWWLSLQPRQDRDWQPEYERLSHAELDGSILTVHNLRNFDFLDGDTVVPRWETRRYNLDHLEGVDLFLNFWGSPWMAHPILSFRFSDAPPLAFSIETRREEGETFSMIGGLYRMFELFLVATDERDVIRVRTNVREGETVHLYRLALSPESARERLLEFISTLNELKTRPQWYHALTANCTTAIRTQRSREERTPWDWRILLNGKLDEMLYERGYFYDTGLEWSEMRERSVINQAAESAHEREDFSQFIRQGHPAF